MRLRECLLALATTGDKWSQTILAGDIVGGAMQGIRGQCEATSIVVALSARPQRMKSS